MHLRRLGLIGVGLIGGSLARALKRAGVVDEIVGCGTDEQELQSAVQFGVVDRYALRPIDAARGADMVMIATPVGAIRHLLEAVAPVMTDTTVVSDTGSVKVSVVAAAREVLGLRFRQFVPGHPIAGTEKSGVGASVADLFVDQRVILSPEPETDASACATVQALWEAAGARVEQMPAAEHDAVLAYTSHLPHMVAYALVDCLTRAEPTSELLRFAAGGFRDITRIASSHPRMWRDIALANRDELLQALGAYQVSLGAIAAAIERNDGAALEDIFARARRTRERLASLAGGAPKGN